MEHQSDTSVSVVKDEESGKMDLIIQVITRMEKKIDDITKDRLPKMDHSLNALKISNQTTNDTIDDLKSLVNNKLELIDMVKEKQDNEVLRLNKVENDIKTQSQKIESIEQEIDNSSNDEELKKL